MKPPQFFFLSVSVFAAGLAGGMSATDKLLSWKDAEKQGAILKICFSLSLCLQNLVLLCTCLLLSICIVCIQEFNEITISLKIKYKSKCFQEQGWAL